MKKSKGFTLIELLVVIAIIGILATIVLVSLNTARTKARDVRRVSDLRQVALALEMYYDEHAYYPPAAAANSCTNASWDSMSTEIQTHGYMAQAPNDPTDTGNYVYAYGTNAIGTSATDYDLRAVLENNITTGALATDVDTSTICAAGLTCVDPAYCIEP
jgi:type II secretion system protein G